jgi:hypothetical protein
MMRKGFLPSLLKRLYLSLVADPFFLPAGKYPHPGLWYPLGYLCQFFILSFCRIHFDHFFLK